jgi:membrane associated rhomboid family serine protease
VYGSGGYQGGGGGIGFGPPQTPQIIKQLLIANAAIFLLSLPPAFYAFARLGAATPILFWQQGFLWQPFTYMWFHGGLMHIAMNMFVLWMFGSPLAMVWGPRRFIRFYLVCGVGAGLLIVTFPYLAVYLLGYPALQLQIPTVGASGAVYGVVLAYSLTWPNRTIMLIFPPVAFRAIWIIPVMFFMTLIGDRSGTISHVGHLGGVAVAWIYLRRSGEGGRLLPTREQLRYRLHRWRMRRRLRAVRREEQSSRGRHDDRTLH